MKKVKLRIPEKLRKEIPLKTAPNHTVLSQVTDESFTVHTRLPRVVVTNREDDIKKILELHDKRVMTERRIAQFTNEFSCHLLMGSFMGNWVYLLCAQLAYNLWLCIRDLVLPPFCREKHTKRIRRAIGLIASKVTREGRQIRLKIWVLHRRWRDFVWGWQRIPELRGAWGAG